MAAERKLRGTDCASIVMRWRHGQVEVNGPAGVSGVQLEDNGSAVHCWRCVLDVEADDWKDVENGSHGFTATPGFAADWTRHCTPCRKSWRRAADDAI